MPVGNRAFWINKNMTSDVLALDIALCQKGHRVSHFGVTEGGVLVITEPWFPVPPEPPNDPDHPGVLRSGPSDGSTISGRVVSVPVSELEWLRDCSDLEIRDGDTARGLAQAWLGEGVPATKIIAKLERK